MGSLILGVSGWSAAHWMKRLAPGLRGALTARLGEGSNGVIAVLLVLSIVAMVLGYQRADFTQVWTPPAFFTHINNLLMLMAFYCFGASARKTDRVWLGTKLRHPQLTGFIIWAIAHLLVNGDVASVILFGGLLLWAALSIRLINRAEGPWTPPPRAPVKSEIVLVVITLVLFSIVAAIHTWLGYSPFGG
ncbi:MAG: NnrU family protein [Pseudomonadota bacterium]